MSVRRFLRLLLCLLFGTFFTACMGTSAAGRRGPSKVIDVAPRQSPMLMIARESRSVVVEWNSVKGEMYTLMYRDRESPKAPWSPFAEASRMAGTGERMTVRDISPGAFNRSYMLQLGSESVSPRNP